MGTLRLDVYEAMKRRIKVLPYDEIKPHYDESGFEVSPDAIFYMFDPGVVNDGYDELDVDYVDCVIQPIRTKNLWNVCQRFYSLIKDFEDIDKRLLK